uniref:Uncharacterized protein n=1 Tax=Arundo donax TaxID=35708 RepID=A0A0A9CKH3_ARUDO
MSKMFPVRFCMSKLYIHDSLICLVFKKSIFFLFVSLYSETQNELDFASNNAWFISLLQVLH